MTHLEGGRAALGSLLAAQNRTKGWILGDVLVPSDLLRKAKDRSSTISQCPGCRWQLCPLVPSLLVSPLPLSPSPPWPAGLRALPIRSSRVLCMACPRVPSSSWARRGPLCIFLSCFTFHFRIPCRRTPLPAPQSSPSLQVSRSDFVHLTGHMGRRMTGPARESWGTLSPALQPSGGAAAGHWPVCVATWSLRVGHRGQAQQMEVKSLIHPFDKYLSSASGMPGHRVGAGIQR